MIKTKWLIYTVLIGLMPFFIRVFIVLFDKRGSFGYLFNEIDFISFGLILNLSVINELEDKIVADKVWKSRVIGFSIFSILILSAILAIVTYSDFNMNKELNRNSIKICAILLAVVNFVLNYAVYNKLNVLNDE
ncbi:hypothetical protein D3C81_898820 [compost metagenome]|uniref:hypothetical protein n=1 Tax=Sphingobacterium sp. DR205 TaxID=2713573 RepID=UPI000FBE09AD|nr:hypothetical protein [Sphingobacterium sp. DR205]QIH36881.1 hypothetical protein G6053_30315 [Sphingobacterium sp. DR205]